MDDADYDAELEALQTELVSLQIWAMETGRKIAVVFEGRDAAGKDGVIKRITEHLAVRSTRVVALPKPSDREKTQWWFQRYTAHLPAAGELVLFNRSWYNRGGVEVVMGFSTTQEQADFLREAPAFEQMLVQSDVLLLKYWLDISKAEQAERLEDRRHDPLKRLKVSPLDAVAQEKWDAYSEARNRMLAATHTAWAPWTCVRADKKKPARLNLIRHLLRAADRPGVEIDKPDEAVVFPFTPDAVSDGRLAP